MDKQVSLRFLRYCSPWLPALGALAPHPYSRQSEQNPCGLLFLGILPSVDFNSSQTEQTIFTVTITCENNLS
jgi:hypothetical protein